MRQFCLAILLIGVGLPAAAGANVVREIAASETLEQATGLAQSHIQRLLKEQKFSEAVGRAEQILAELPHWKTLDDSRLAEFWTLLGRAYIGAGRIGEAIWPLERAKACWDTKRLLWKAMDEDNFKKYRGLDRFNPLNIEAQGLLFAAAIQVGTNEKADALLAAWAEQVAVLESVPDATTKAELFRRALRSEVRAAGQLLNLPAALERLKAYAHPEGCSGYLMPKVKGGLI